MVGHRRLVAKETVLLMFQRLKLKGLLSHKTPFLPPQILHKHCFLFLLGPLYIIYEEAFI